MTKEEQNAADTLAAAIVEVADRLGFGVEMSEHLGPQGLRDLMEMADRAAK